MNYKIDICNTAIGLKIFEINREVELDAVHATIVYQENGNELLVQIKNGMIY